MFGLFRAKSHRDSGRERRQAERVPVRVPATIVISKDKSLPCRTMNVSTSGAKLDLPRDRMLPSEFEVVIPARKLRRRAKLVWRNEDSLGVQFI
ncbi:PilZ domain-containing protein [Enterovirga aerilata]|uniref:PilZ domain-containing protein n=1 Tax=Enterovirga aerilata TaxID=2730920 RepID=A0A849I611_9HYPH|nr:PilZ domain-containing protein [Enterovirga sp. DB1703]NNM72761.1 PilZ domain-containing protein [Enterovirga sp. DB1703]